MDQVFATFLPIAIAAKKEEVYHRYFRRSGLRKIDLRRTRISRTLAIKYLQQKLAHKLNQVIFNELVSELQGAEITLIIYQGNQAQNIADTLSGLHIGIDASKNADQYRAFTKLFSFHHEDSYKGE